VRKFPSLDIWDWDDMGYLRELDGCMDLGNGKGLILGRWANG